MAAMNVDSFLIADQAPQDYGIPVSLRLLDTKLAESLFQNRIEDWTLKGVTLG
jgi:hypothetical protein